MRSDRIHHRERLKKARRFHWGKDLRSDPKEAGVVVDTPTKCSCWMCGNPRRHTGERTIQEQRADVLFRRLGLDG